LIEELMILKRIEKNKMESIIDYEKIVASSNALNRQLDQLI